MRIGCVCTDRRRIWVQCSLVVANCSERASHCSHLWHDTHTPCHIPCHIAIPFYVYIIVCIVWALCVYTVVADIQDVKDTVPGPPLRSLRVSCSTLTMNVNIGNAR